MENEAKSKDGHPIVGDAFILRSSASCIPHPKKIDPPYEVTTKMRGHAERHMMNIRDIYEKKMEELNCRISEANEILKRIYDVDGANVSVDSFIVLQDYVKSLK